MQNHTMRYFLYARKSTDEADRQVLSIEAQLAELREYARREGLVIAREFIESKTAKEPGREVFNEMVAGLEQGAAHGIVAWHPDRLARNSIDGGRIIYLVDTGKVLELKFPTFWFDATPQGKFMLSIAFGQSKYFIDNLAENVKRGLRQKLRNGIFPALAPIGYKNDTKNHTIVVDPVLAPLVKRTFELYASGRYPIRDLRDTMNGLGLKRWDKDLANSNYQKILKNPFYYGVIRYLGEYYEGKHTPLISKALYNKCQEVMARKSRHTHAQKGLKPYVYRAAFRCAECGCYITTETQKGHNYLHCTKRKMPCSQLFVREERIDEQVRDILKGVSLPPALAAEALDNIKKEKSKAAQAGERAAQNLRDKIDILNQRMNALLDMVLSGQLTQAEYALKKRSFVEEKKEIEMKLAAFARQGDKRFEPVRAFYQSASHVGEAAISGNPAENLQILKNIGSNLIIGGKRISYKLTFPWEKLQNFNAAAAAATGKKAVLEIWGG